MRAGAARCRFVTDATPHTRVRSKRRSVAGADVAAAARRVFVAIVVDGGGGGGGVFAEGRSSIITSGIATQHTHTHTGHAPTTHHRPSPAPCIASACLFDCHSTRFTTLHFTTVARCCAETVHQRIMLTQLVDTTLKLKHRWG